MVAIHAVYYNFARIHKTLRITPAMAAGLPITFGVLRKSCSWPIATCRNLASVALTRKESRKAVADEQVIKLLEEIKDLQKDHLANQKEALQNQKGALRRQKIMMGVYVLFMLALLGFLAWSSWPHAG